MGYRDGVIQQYPKNGAWAEIKIYRVEFLANDSRSHALPEVLPAEEIRY
jgi:hypothetical protein